MKSISLLLLIIFYHTAYSQFSYGPVLSLSAEFPKMELSDVSGSGSIEIENKLILMLGGGFYAGKQFESNFMLQLQALFHTKSRMAYNLGSDTYEIEYWKFTSDLLGGYKLNYNIRLLFGLNVTVPVMDQDDIDSFQTALDNTYPDTFPWRIDHYSKEALGSILIGADYFTDKFNFNLTYNIPVGNPYLDLDSDNYGGYELTHPSFELTCGLNLNR